MSNSTPPVAKLSVPRPWEIRKFGECAFPLDRAGETYSCCEPVKAERNYCKAHCAVMYVSTPPMGAKRQKAA